MRADLVSVTGNGLNLSFTAAGTGDVLVDLGGATTLTPTVTGATIVSLTDVNGQNQLELDLTSAGTNVVSITLAAPPTITGTAAGQATTDLATIAPFSTVTIADTNASPQTETVTVTLSAAANGTLSNLGGGTYTAATGVYTDTGTAAVVTAALDGLVFTPTANQVAPGSTVTTGFTIVDTDTAVATATDSTTTVVATDVAVPPTITGTVAGQLTSDRQTIAPFSKVTIADLNLGQTETVTVTLSAAANGTLSNLGGFVNTTAGVYTDTGTTAVVATSGALAPVHRSDRGSTRPTEGDGHAVGSREWRAVGPGRRHLQCHNRRLTDTGTAAVVTAALDALVFTPTINQVRQARPSPPPLPSRTPTRRWPLRQTARRPSSPPTSVPRR